MKLNPKYNGRYVDGAGGARLFVEENGDPTKPTILWIHGYSQCRLSWDNQFENEDALRSDLPGLAIRIPGTDSQLRVYGFAKLSAWTDLNGRNQTDAPTGVDRQVGAVEQCAAAHSDDGAGDDEERHARGLTPGAAVWKLVSAGPLRGGQSPRLVVRHLDHGTDLWIHLARPA